MKRVTVVWLDTGTHYGVEWVDVNTLPRNDMRLSKVETTGYLVHEDEEAIYIGLSTAGSNDSYAVFGVQTIARQAIISVQEVAFFKDVSEEYKARTG